MEKLIEFTSKQWNDYAIILNYKKANFRILVESLTPSQQKTIEGTSFRRIQHLLDHVISIKVKLILNQYSFLLINMEFRSDSLITKITPTEYISYNYVAKYGGSREIKVQKNGFFVYCAPTGQGKTWFALSNLESLSKQFDTLLYINFELSIDDIKNRCFNMNINIPRNLYVSPMDNVGCHTVMV